MKFEMFKSAPKAEQAPVNTGEQKAEGKTGLIKMAAEKFTGMINKIISAPQAVVEKNLQDPEKLKATIKKVAWMGAALVAAGITVAGFSEFMSGMGGPDHDFSQVPSSEVNKSLIAIFVTIGSAVATVYTGARAKFENDTIKEMGEENSKMDHMEGIAA